jgi:LytS/YehU family sensor histidine kinase
MAVRLSGRATFDIRVAPDAGDALVPSFLLQPLVENAIRHGIERRPGAGRLEVVARRRLDVLEIEVRDDGAGFDPDTMREGTGLRVTRERLVQLYGDAHHFALRLRVGDGVIASLSIPYRPAVPAATPALAASA